MKHRNYMFLNFKAKTVENNKWVYGTPIKTQSGEVYMVNDMLEHILVRDETLCQQTSSTDKNNKLIYEGDIIATMPSKITKTQNYGIIRYGDEPGYLNSVVNAWRIHWAEYNHNTTNFEIIGNIHDDNFHDIEWIKERYPKAWKTIYSFVETEYKE